jgi:hypothetical protein
MIKEKDIATIVEAKAEFETYEKTELWDQLLAHTYYIFDRKYVVPEKGEILRDRCRGVILDAIERVIITGVRKWNRSHYPDFKIFLFGVIDSIIIDDFRKKKDNIETIELLNKDDGSNEGSDDNLNVKELYDICVSLLKELNASENEMTIFECIAEGMKMPGEIRDFLEIDHKEFHNLSRNFNTKWKKVLIKLNEHGYRA